MLGQLPEPVFATWDRYMRRGPSQYHRSLLLAYLCMRLDNFLGIRRSLSAFCPWMVDEAKAKFDPKAAHRARVLAAVAECRGR